LPSWMATIRPVTPPSTRSIATFANVVATSEIDRIGLAAPEVVGQLRREGLDARPFPDLGRQGLADIGLVTMAEGVRATDIGHLRAPARWRPRPSRTKA
jgi:hypothetical protein